MQTIAEIHDVTKARRQQAREKTLAEKRELDFAETTRRFAKRGRQDSFWHMRALLEG